MSTRYWGYVTPSSSSIGRYRAVTARDAAYRAKQSWSSRATLGDGVSVMTPRVGRHPAGGRRIARLRPSVLRAVRRGVPECPADPNSPLDDRGLSGTDSTSAPLDP